MVRWVRVAAAVCDGQFSCVFFLDKIADVPVVLIDRCVVRKCRKLWKSAVAVRCYAVRPRGLVQFLDKVVDMPVVCMSCCASATVHGVFMEVIQLVVELGVVMSNEHVELCRHMHDFFVNLCQQQQQQSCLSQECPCLLHLLLQWTLASSPVLELHSDVGSDGSAHG